MALMDELAEDLARKTMAAMDEMGDDRFHEKVSRVIGELSPTLQEAYMTAMRLSLASRRGHGFLDRALAAHRGDGAAPEAPRDTSV
ncbi:hypothetical protein [Solirhodobacter olei]|uniref:hypothetical protein n=1 Tax=Solirhodobacter olei TaxID=2493082 RepID=UPI000FDB39DD|nr:hypothetical protein [Solirhodobacter olei]